VAVRRAASSVAGEDGSSSFQLPETAKRDYPSTVSGYLRLENLFPHEIITRTSAFWLGLEFRVVRLVFTVKLGL